MNHKLYSIYDTASGVYNQIFQCKTHGEATRIFKDLSISADTNIGKHPEDYSLWYIGLWNDNDGKITKVTKECLATALEMVSLAQNVTRDNQENLH